MGRVQDNSQSRHGCVGVGDCLGSGGEVLGRVGDGGSNMAGNNRGNALRHRRNWDDCLRSLRMNRGCTNRHRRIWNSRQCFGGG